MDRRFKGDTCPTCHCLVATDVNGNLYCINSVCEEFKKPKKKDHPCKQEQNKNDV